MDVVCGYLMIPTCPVVVGVVKVVVPVVNIISSSPSPCPPGDQFCLKPESGSQGGFQDLLAVKGVLGAVVSSYSTIPETLP